MARPRTLQHSLGKCPIPQYLGLRWDRALLHMHRAGWTAREARVVNGVAMRKAYIEYRSLCAIGAASPAHVAHRLWAPLHRIWKNPRGSLLQVYATRPEYRLYYPAPDGKPVGWVRVPMRVYNAFKGPKQLDRSLVEDDDDLERVAARLIEDYG